MLPRSLYGEWSSLLLSNLSASGRSVGCGAHLIACCRADRGWQDNGFIATGSAVRAFVWSWSPGARMMQERSARQVTLPRSRAIRSSHSAEAGGTSPATHASATASLAESRRRCVQPPLLHGTDLKIARGRACRSALCLIRYGPLSIVVWREGARILRALERVQLVRRSALPIALRQGGLYAKGRICRPDIKRSFDSRNCFDPVACRDAMVGTANEVNKSAQAILVTVPPGRYVMSRGLPDDQAQ